VVALEFGDVGQQREDKWIQSGRAQPVEGHTVRSGLGGDEQPQDLPQMFTRLLGDLQINWIGSGGQADEAIHPLRHLATGFHGASRAEAADGTSPSMASAQAAAPRQAVRQSSDAAWTAVHRTGADARIGL
jgi:hypothetical protein